MARIFAVSRTCRATTSWLRAQAIEMTARSDIVTAARGWIGTPYRHQASVKGAGCDCLGLLRGVWREVVGPEPQTPPAYTAGWAEAPGAAGGEAMEVISGAQVPSLTRDMARLCCDSGLEASCGSDFHSPNQPWASLGHVAPLPEDCVPIWRRWQ